MKNIKMFINKAFVFIFFAAVILCSSSDTAKGAVRYVNFAAVGANNGTSWANAYTDLKTAITAAVAGDEIWVAQGTYKPTATATRTIYFNLKAGVSIYGGFNSGDALLTDRDYIANQTILSGDIGVSGVYTDDTYHVVYNNVAIVGAVLDGFIIEYGNSTGAANNDGGGLYFTNCNPTIANCIIRNNYCTRDGGGVYIGSSSGVSLISCTISDNLCGDDGAGVFVSASSPTINLCTIDNNQAFTASGSLGGGIHITGASNPTITSNTITNNKAVLGGGIYSESTTFTNNISGNTISLNTVESLANSTGRGGGIYITSSSPGIVSNTISNNIAQGAGANTGSGNGGGIYINNKDCAITGNTIAFNSATTIGTGTTCGEGGGIYLYRSSSVISANVISDNTAIRYGAGVDAIQCNISFSSNTLDNNTVTAYANSYGYGGGMFVDGNHNVALVGPTITSNTFSNNDAFDGGFTTAGYGGGIFIQNSLAVIASNTFTTNTSTQYGGGVYLTSDIDVVFDAGNTILNNSSARGAGLANRGSSDGAFLSGISIHDNIASLEGGGIYIEGTATIPIFNKTFIYGNTSVKGAGIFIEGAPRPIIQNTLIHSNIASADGGGIYFNTTYTPGTFDLLNVTIADNQSVNGGGIFCNSSSDPRLKNCVLWGNTGTGPQVYLNDTGSDPFFNYCDVSGSNAGFAGAGSGGSYTAGNYTNNINSDPLFDGSYNIQVLNSPCIGAGNPATVAGDFNPADEDIISLKRVRGVVDIGAFESNNPPQFVTLPYPPTTDNPGPMAVVMSEDGTPTAFSLTLSAIDLDIENLTWSIQSTATNGTASVVAASVAPNPQSQVITYTPTANYNGTDAFTVRVSDGLLTDDIIVNVTIDPINDAPTFSTSAVTAVKSTHLYSYTIGVSDVDNASGSLTLTCPVIPAWLTFTDFGNGSGILTGTPTDLEVGLHNVTIQVSDGSLTTQQIFVIDVASRYIFVPADFATIQQGIDAAAPLDKVVVSPGIYIENIVLDNKNIEVEGDPLVPANVVIQGAGLNSVISIINGGSSTISGFKITSGTGHAGIPSVFTLHAPGSGFFGGGVYCYQGNVTLNNLQISGNTLSVAGNYGGSGAAIYIGNVSTVTIGGSKTSITANSSSTYRGGGICIDDSNVTITGAAVGQEVIIDGNYGGNYGGGIALYNSTLSLKKCKSY